MFDLFLKKEWSVYDCNCVCVHVCVCLVVDIVKKRRLTPLEYFRFLDSKSLPAITLLYLSLASGTNNLSILCVSSVGVPVHGVPHRVNVRAVPEINALQAVFAAVGLSFP